MLEQEVLADISPLKITKDRSKSNLSRFNSTASSSSSFSSSQASTSGSSSCSRSFDDVLTPLPSSATCSNNNTSLSRPRPRPAPLVQAVRNHRDRHQSWQIACRLAERAEEMFEESLWIGGSNVEEAMIRARIAREEENSSRSKVDAAAMTILQLKRRNRKGGSDVSQTESIPESVSSIESCASSSISTSTTTSSELELEEIEEEEEVGASIQMAQRVAVVSPKMPSSPVIHSCGCIGTCFCSAVWSLMG